jgi:hypothetical protein
MLFYKGWNWATTRRERTLIMSFEVGTATLMYSKDEEKDGKSSYHRGTPAVTLFVIKGELSQTLVDQAAERMHGLRAVASKKQINLYDKRITSEKDAIETYEDFIENIEIILAARRRRTPASAPKSPPQYHNIPPSRR